MSQNESRKFYQFQIQHLLGLLTGAAVLFAILAPRFRQLDPADRLAAALKSLLVVAVTLGIMAFLVVRRQKLERQAGPAIERFERRSSRIVSFLVGVALWVAYAATILVETETPNLFDVMPGDGLLLFIAVNYSVVRFWWRIDPMGIEAHERGLILGGVQFYPWDAISRYSWTGTPPRQLNLFLSKRMVLNLKVDASFAGRLDEILANHATV